MALRWDIPKGRITSQMWCGHVIFYVPSQNEQDGPAWLYPVERLVHHYRVSVCVLSMAIFIYEYADMTRYVHMDGFNWKFLLMNDFLGYSNFRKPSYIYICIHVYIYILSCPELCGYPLLSQPSRRSVGWEWHWRCPDATRDILGHWCHRHLEWKDHGFFRMKPWCKSYR